MFEEFWKIRVTIFTVNIGVIGVCAVLGWLIGKKPGLIIGVCISLPLALVLTSIAVKRQAQNMTWKPKNPEVDTEDKT